MGGYNSTIFAYGQTGAGKTYTMQGPLGAALQDGHDEVGQQCIDAYALSIANKSLTYHVQLGHLCSCVS